MRVKSRLQVATVRTARSASRSRPLLTRFAPHGQANYARFSPPQPPRREPHVAVRRRDPCAAAGVANAPCASPRPPRPPPDAPSPRARRRRRRASGPRSITQSASLITSRLCSMITSVCPASTSRSNTRASLRMSSRCSPVVGSSITYSLRVFVFARVRQLARDLDALRLAAATASARAARA